MGSIKTFSDVSGIGRCGMQYARRERLGLRRVASLGLWAIDRGMGSCSGHRSEACRDCYNRKMIKLFANTRKAVSPGGVDDQKWNHCRSEAFSGLARVRLCTRGEAFASLADVDRACSWIKSNPSTLFWVPTRAWQGGIRGDHALDLPMINKIESTLFPLSNCRVQASVDPFTAQHYPVLIERGWSTMFFESKNLPDAYAFAGKHPAEGLIGSNVLRCVKTWQKKHGVCQRCSSGCFGSVRSDVWLKRH